MRRAIRLTLPVLLALAAPAGAAVFTVTKTADTLDGACDADCSLREAVTAANAANAAPGADSVILGPGVYRLTRLGPFENASATGDLDILGDLGDPGGLTILGAGADRTILDGNGTDRVLEVRPEAGLELRGVTVRNGWARGAAGQDSQGGGIRGAGRLTLVDCLISGNRADTGGGVSSANLTARGTTFTGNTGIYGGGLFSFAGLEMENVTLAGNVGRYGGGAMLVDSEEGLHVSHATIAGNEATSTGGGIYLDGLVCPAGDPGCPTGPFLRLDRSIVAGNTAPQFPDCSYMAHMGLDNVFGSGDGCSPSLGDRAGTPGSPLDPKLSPLGAYGGPTPTRPPLPGSPAVDLAAGYLCSGTDQRGRLRPADGDGDGVAACDAGAVETGLDCLAGGEELCLGAGDRFRITARWNTRDGSGNARVLPLTRDTGAFWFFNSANLEMVLKILDGCAINDRFWVFLSGLTDVGVEVTVQDSQTGETWTHTHPAGSPLPTRLDTDALDVCPETP